MSNTAFAPPLQGVRALLYSTLGELNRYMRHHQGSLEEESGAWCRLDGIQDYCDEIKTLLYAAMQDDSRTPDAAQLAFQRTNDVLEAWFLVCRDSTLSQGDFVHASVTVMQAMMRTLWHFPHVGRRP